MQLLMRLLISWACWWLRSLHRYTQSLHGRAEWCHAQYRGANCEENEGAATCSGRGMSFDTTPVSGLLLEWLARERACAFTAARRLPAPGNRLGQNA